MKAVAILYFFFSGLLFFGKGASVIGNGAHVGSALFMWLGQQRMDAIAANDANRAAVFGILSRDLLDGLAKEKCEGFQGGLLLCAFGFVHLCITVWLLHRFRILRFHREFSSGRPNKTPEPTTTSDTVAAEPLGVPAAVVAHL